MLVYVLAVGAAFLFATGSVIQQRAASEAPPEKALSFALLLWLVRRRVWLAGVACSLIGNLLAAAALGLGGVALVQPLLNVRLLFALALVALISRVALSRRDWSGAVAAAVGLGVFVAAARPRQGDPLDVELLTWVLALGVIWGLVGLLFLASRRLDPARQATLLAAGAGILFALQAALTEVAMHVLGDDGPLALLVHWQPYVLIACALVGAVLIQSAYNEAPLTASYPALVTTEPLAGIAIGVVVLGGALNAGALALVVGIAALALMTGGVYLLATSPLITGQLDALRRRRDEGQAFKTAAELEEDLQALYEDMVAFERDPDRQRQRIARHLRCAEEELARLRELQRDMARYRESEKEELESLAPKEAAALEPLEQELDQRESDIAETVGRLEQRLESLRGECTTLASR